MPVSRNEIDRIVPLPPAPALGEQLARLEVEGHAEAVGGLRVGVVGGRHAQVHEGMNRRAGKLFLFPYVLKKAADAPVVPAFGEALAA
jgi:hypothetical protein